MKYDLVIFDLDGTLLDTVEDLRGALNHALAEAGYPEKTKDEMKLIIGGGVYNHVVKALPVGTDKAVIDSVFAEFKGYYDTHCNVTTLPFPGRWALHNARVAVSTLLEFTAALIPALHITFSRSGMPL